MTLALWIIFFIIKIHQSWTQVIDVRGYWDANCPQTCSCQISRFSDLPLNQWLNPTLNEQSNLEDDFYSNEHFLAEEFLRSATCVLTGNPTNLLSQLPSDLQAFTILESGSGDEKLELKSEDLQRFTQLIALDIQGIERENENRTKEKSGIIMAADTLLPLGLNLLYLNLERVTLTGLSLMNKNKANLVVEQVIENATENQSPKNGHRLIFLSQQNVENEDKEILPYDIYKQELDGATSGLFTGLSVLTHLRVYDCALKNLSWHMFDGLKNLLYLSLEKNYLKFIPEFCFYGTPKLKSLSLAENQILTLSSVDLAGLLMLERLDLSGNNLTFLSELSFPPFPALLLANFRDNPFDDLFPNTFEIMNRTTKLYIGGTGSKIRLQKNSFLGLRNLELLQVFSMDVPILERFILHGMPGLINLKMQGNITSIDFDAFMDLDFLEELDLSNCNIRYISMDAFYGLKSVRKIDLSNNKLDFIPPGLFTVQQQTKLREIYLNRNFLTRLGADFFKNLRTFNKSFYVQTLRLESNPWDCTCAMELWNPLLVNKAKDTAPRCFTPKRLRNWGIFHALRKGGLQCKRPKRRHWRTSNQENENNSIN